MSHARKWVNSTELIRHSGYWWHSKIINSLNAVFSEVRLKLDYEEKLINSSYTKFS